MKECGLPRGVYTQVKERGASPHRYSYQLSFIRLGGVVKSTLYSHYIHTTCCCLLFWNNKKEPRRIFIRSSLLLREKMDKGKTI